MDISIVHHYSVSLGRGGEKMITSIVHELESRGHSVSVYALPLRRGGAGVAIRKYRERLFSFVRSDVVYYIYVPLIRRLFPTKSPKIAGVHSFAPFLKFGHEPVGFFQLLRKHGPLATAAVLYTRLTKNRELHSYDAVHIPNVVLPEPLGVRTYLIPNWVDTSVFKLGTKDDVFTVLYVGSRAWSKGFDIFYNVASRLSKIIPARFVAVGVGGGSGGVVETHPYVSDVEKLAGIYSGAHLLLHPTRADIFGVTLLEAMASGTPVLTSALPSHLAFVPRWHTCSSTQCYVEKTVEIYKMWADRTGEYEALVDTSLTVAKKFDKEKIFPQFEKMLIEVARCR